jgi:hypothetical protein
MPPGGDHDGLMTTGPGEGAAEARARLQGKRIALGVVITVAVAFVGASALQIIPAVFGVGFRPLPSSPPGSSTRDCAEGVHALLGTVGADPNKAAPAAEWERVGHACESTPEGLDAWAALQRLRFAASQMANRGAGVELDPLRRDVAAHLPAELR